MRPQFVWHDAVLVFSQPRSTQIYVEPAAPIQLGLRGKVVALLGSLLGACIVFASTAVYIDNDYDRVPGLAELGIALGGLLLASTARLIASGVLRDLATVAVPLMFLVGVSLLFLAYRDCCKPSRRSLVAEGVSRAADVQSAVADFYAKHGILPNSNVDAGLSAASDFAHEAVHSIAVRDGGRIVVSFGTPDVDGPFSGQSLEIHPDVGSGRVRWQCKGGSMPEAYRPEGCR